MEQKSTNESASADDEKLYSMPNELPKPTPPKKKTTKPNPDEDKKKTTKPDPNEDDDRVSADNCRICLKSCRKTKWPISLAQANVYQQVTGFKIHSTDVTIMCCTICSNFLDDLVAFRKKSVRVEMKLKVYRANTMTVQPSLDISIVKQSHSPPTSMEMIEEALDDDDDEDPLVQVIDPNTVDAADDSSSSWPEVKTKIEQVEVDEEENTSTGPKSYSCQFCDEPFGFETFSKEELKKHYTDVHYTPKRDPAEPGKRKTWMCQICAKTFRAKSFLETHQAKEHIKELNMRVFECDSCPQKFGSSRVLQSHINDRHTERCCPVCGKKVKEESCLA